ncbi:hypothetical protein HDU99_008242, partial [Rhizoclosmatium hyalinum]
MTYKPAVAQTNKDTRPFWKKVLTSITFWLVIATILGCIIGSYAPQFSKDAAPTANIFMRPIQFVVLPLVFASLVGGIAGHGDLKALGRLALKTFIYFELVTTLALLFGLIAANT